MTDNIPTFTLTIGWPVDTPYSDEAEQDFNDFANQQIIDCAAELRRRGERPWMEVWYRGVPGRADTTAEDFDAVEVSEDGTITTLPPYAELLEVQS